MWKNIQEMSSGFNMLGLYDDAGLNLAIVLPVVVVLVSLVLLLIKIIVRKPEIAKKLQSGKKQKVTTSKEKDEKPISDRKYKINKEKKTLPSPAKTFDMSGDSLKSKSSKKAVVNEKSPQKVVQSKKQHNNNSKNSPSKNQCNIKQLESLISKEDEGEWQMVTTKKQKTKQEEVIEATTLIKSNKKSQKSPDKAIRTDNKTKNVKEANENSTISTTTIANGKVTASEIKQFVKSVPSSQDRETVITNFGNHSAIQQETSVIESDDSNKVTFVKKSEDDTYQAQSALSASVAFDELGDNGWTDTKPQKKNRRKALRE